MHAISDERVTIGRIERPFGIKGEVKVRSLSDVPGRFEHLGQVSVVIPDGRMIEMTVTHARRAGATFIMGLEGITSPEEAGAFRGGLIQIPRAVIPSSAEHTYYECDLIGMNVESETGQEIGVIDSIWDMPGNHHVLVIRKGSQEVLIPAARDLIAKVDVDRRRLTVRA
ncbi:MAG TPA: ribosome maturation factor RimM, partial [Nitrospiraceae bacterium]